MEHNNLILVLKFVPWAVAEKLLNLVQVAAKWAAQKTQHADEMDLDQRWADAEAKGPAVAEEDGPVEADEQGRKRQQHGAIERAQ